MHLKHCKETIIIIIVNDDDNDVVILLFVCLKTNPHKGYGFIFVNRLLSIAQWGKSLVWRVDGLRSIPISDITGI